MTSGDRNLDRSRNLHRQKTIEIHLYGKLRRFAHNQDPTRDSLVHAPVMKDDTISDVLTRLGIPLKEIGSNIFLNYQYSGLNRRVQEGDRLAVFPDDMQLLYKWYFGRIGAEENDQSQNSALRHTSKVQPRG
jgi:hypothetical protein